MYLLGNCKLLLRDNKKYNIFRINAKKWEGKGLPPILYRCYFGCLGWIHWWGSHAWKPTLKERIILPCTGVCGSLALHENGRSWESSYAMHRCMTQWFVSLIKYIWFGKKKKKKMIVYWSTDIRQFSVNCCLFSQLLTDPRWSSVVWRCKN